MIQTMRYKPCLRIKYQHKQHTKHCILCHCGNFSRDTYYGKVYKCHPKSLLVHLNADYRNKVWCIMHPYIVLMKCSHGRLKTGCKPLSKCQFLHHYKSTIPKCLKKKKNKLTNNARSTFSVRSTSHLQVHSLSIVVCVIIWSYALQ